MGLIVHVSLMLSISMLLATSCIATKVQPVVFNVIKYGAKADGKTDISKAVMAAFKEACSSKKPSKVHIPKGTYFCGQVKLTGPCSSTVKFQVQGILKAPTHLPGDGWFTFQHIDHFTMYGGGTFDGQGHKAWAINNCAKDPNCKSLAVTLRFDFISNGKIVDITSRDSKNFHVNVLGCKNLLFQRFKIIAPKESLNTDGIHIGRSNGINILDTSIATGDDCISLGDGSQEVKITRVKCGPGHGISVGSLGKYPNEEPVSGIYVKNCTLVGTDNGVRIKTWPAMYASTASNIHFEDIFMDKVSNPILIDQVYCPWNQCNKKAASKVKISDVSFRNIRGTSATPVAVQLACSSGIPCEKVELSNINLKYNGGKPKSQCSNVRPKISGTMSAAGCGHV